MSRSDELAESFGDGPPHANSVPRESCMHPIPNWDIREQPGRGLEIDLYCIYCDSGETVNLSFEDLLSPPG